MDEKTVSLDGFARAQMRCTLNQTPLDDAGRADVVDGIRRCHDAVDLYVTVFPSDAVRPATWPASTARSSARSSSRSPDQGVRHPRRHGHLGHNSDGELGHDGSEELSTVPVRVEGLTRATDVSVNYQHGYAALSDGTVRAWGQNHHGGLGNGVDCDRNTRSCRSNPVQVSNLTGVVAVAAIGNAGLALDSEGRFWMWGANSSAEFGDGTVGWDTDYAVVPRQVPDLASVETLEPAMFSGRTIVPSP